MQKTTYLIFISLILAVLECNTAHADWPKSIQVGSKGYEVALLQSTLNECQNQNLAVDGIFGNGTKNVVIAFQQAKALIVDGKVGPQTWKALFSAAPRYVIRFKRGTAPNNSPTTPENDSHYECEVKTYRIDGNGTTLLSTHRGSVEPSDINVRGRVNNGWYRLHLGLHKRSKNGQALVPTANDLVVKTNGYLRPCLVVNLDNKVPVTSNNPNKKFSTAIHIHNGFNTGRFSDGCQTLSPSHWSPFISHFLQKYNTLNDWHRNNSYRGREIGVLIIG